LEERENYLNLNMNQHLSDSAKIFTNCYITKDCTILQIYLRNSSLDLSRVLREPKKVY
jgi:hypothetical protein